MYVCLPVCLCAVDVKCQWLHKAVKTTDFKFDAHVPRDSPDDFFLIFEKGVWTVVRVKWLKFWQLHATTSKKVKITDFKFGTQL